MSATEARRRLPVLQGVVPIDRSRVPTDVIAGVTLAALASPRSWATRRSPGCRSSPGSTRSSSRSPSSRSSARRGISWSAPTRQLRRSSPPGSLASRAGGVVGVRRTRRAWCRCSRPGYLFLARIAQLGFIADFLSRTVLIGFLTGVGIQVAIGQVPDMFGMPEGRRGGPSSCYRDALGDLGQTPADHSSRSPRRSSP